MIQIVRDEFIPSFYDVKNMLVIYYMTVMIVRNVNFIPFSSKGNSYSRNKYAFDIKTILFGGKLL